MIQASRIQTLNRRPIAVGQYVLYWMQASQRTRCNHALEFAIDEANRLGQPVVVCFGITDSFPEANARHYQFMLEGLADVQRDLRRRGIAMAAFHERPDRLAVRLAGEASLLVTDRGYLRIQRQWRRHVARHTPCRVIQVESDVVVPVQVASDKEEYSAATLRRKIDRLREEYLAPLAHRHPRRDSLDLRLAGLDLSAPAEVLGRLNVDRSVSPVSQYYLGGQTEAARRLGEFIRRRLAQYAERHNDPAEAMSSDLSPYLHFGQISSLEIALRVAASDAPPAAGADYLEELIVRRELAVNFVYYNRRYDRYECLPAWARRTLAEHASDRRPVAYSLARLESAATDDPYWNAAMREMLVTGKMHGYMRMYWGKKILEWTASPREAFRRALYLNNKHFLDGRDPNGFANVAWCFGKHDRPWAGRPIFGTVRYMNAAGLERKFDMGRYGERIGAI